jgi:nucleoside-diphosphate-sugar epimerase
LKINIFLTGSSGFIGSNFFNSFKKKFNIKKINTKKIIRKVNYRRKLELLFQKYTPSVVIHFAAYYSKTNYKRENKLSKKVNFEFSKTLFNLSKKYHVKYFVNTSTVAEFYRGQFYKKYHYTLYKRKFTKFIKKHKQNYPKVLQIYLNNTYGLNDKRNKLIPKLIKQIKKKKITVYKTNYIIDFVSVNILNKYIANKIFYQNYNDEEFLIKSSKPLTVKKIIDSLMLKNINIYYRKNKNNSYYIHNSIKKIKIVRLKSNIVSWLKKVLRYKLI